MIEMMLVMVVMTVAVTMLASTVSSSTRLGPVQSQRARASEAVREKLEYIRTMPHEQIWALFNNDPSDDPAGPGTAPGPDFTVTELSPLDSDPDGQVGRIRFPGTPTNLREDVNDPVLGMPRDLNMNLVIDSAPISEYAILPVEVSVEWVGGGEDRRFASHTMFIAP